MSSRFATLPLFLVLASGCTVASAPDAPAEGVIDVGVDEASTTPADWRGPSTAYLKADLLVRYEVRDFQQGFLVWNGGQVGTPRFYVSVNARAQSFTAEISGGLSVGESRWYAVPGLRCGQRVDVTIDPQGAVTESNRANNALSFYGWCGL